MLANYGYKDGSGDFFLTIDTDKCTGCGDCVPACPFDVLAMAEDEFDFEREEEVAIVQPQHIKKLKYSCAPCKPAQGYKKSNLPCIRACEPGAIDHSW